jgi:hypothetical protein
MPKSQNRWQKRRRKEELPYSLFQVLRSDENKHADVVFLHTTSKNVFSVCLSGYQDTGDLLLAEWSSNGKLGALYEAKEVTKKEVLLGRCLKNRDDYGILNRVKLSLVEDLR